MRSPLRKNTSLLLGCILLMMSGTVWADFSGEVTGVNLEGDKRRIVILSKGNLGKHSARVISSPNRLVLDFENTGVGNSPSKIKGGGKDNIQEIRVGMNKTSARIVVDFQNSPLPAFQVHRQDDKVIVALGSPVVLDNAAETKKNVSKSPLDPSFVQAAAGNPSEEPKKQIIGNNASEQKIPDQSVRRPGEANARVAMPPKVNEIKAAAEKPAVTQEIKLAQRMDLGAPVQRNPGPLQGPPPGGPSSQSAGSAAQVGPPPAGGPRMVQEVRPPVTPPSPDPRLLVQEITELRFIQVGHNSRLIIRGGDHLDYRMNKVSPTKARLDLINAEIPKVHQKPLRTEQFSTSVEMIVPGSQTIFIQLKDAVPYQVEKKKGVLMIDFPPPRFAIPADHSGGQRGGDTAGREAYDRMRESRREASRAMRELEARRDNEMRRKTIENLQKQTEELQKQRTEILKRYQLTPDPEIFNKPITMNFQGISLKNAFRLLAEQAGINIIIGADVTGNTTLNLVQVPLGQVIDTILSTNGLDREMMGNVMRVGKREEILKDKEDRQAEYQKRIGEVDKRLSETRQEMQKVQEKIESSLKELEKVEAPPEETPEETRTEEIGEAGCTLIGGENVCFYYATVRLVYAAPASIVDTLDCMFNLRCTGARGSVGAPVGALGTQALGEAIQAQTTDLASQGFSSSSPGGIARLERAARLQSNLVRTEAIANQAAISAQQLAQQNQQQGGSNNVSPEDFKLQQVRANSMLWPDATNRMIFIKDTAERIAQMRKLIYSLDVPTPQVLIESRLVQASRSWSRGLGVLWGGRNNQVQALSNSRSIYWGVTGNQAGSSANTATGTTTATGDNIPSTFAVNLPPSAISGLSNLMGLGMQFGLLAGTQYITELDLRLQLGEATGQSKTIARPKVQVLDRQKASIKNGRTIAYSTVSADGTQTQLVNVDLLLDVTPTIYSDGRIRMSIKVTDNDLGGIVNGQQEILTREASTIMTVKDGETAVIGGILRRSENASRQGWPGLMNLPVVNYLFTNRNKSVDITELLVFITPNIVKRPPAAS